LKDEEKLTKMVRKRFGFSFKKWLLKMVLLHCCDPQTEEQLTLDQTSHNKLYVSFVTGQRRFCFTSLFCFMFVLGKVGPLLYVTNLLMLNIE